MKTNVVTVRQNHTLALVINAQEEMYLIYIVMNVAKNMMNCTVTMTKNYAEIVYLKNSKKYI